MIHLLCPGSSEEAATVVAAALQRSCGQGQVCRVSPTQWARRLALNLPGILVVINPLEAWSELIVRALQTARSKVIVFGKLPTTLAQHLGADVQAVTEQLRLAVQCQPASVAGSTESPLRVRYTQIDDVVRSPLADRPFLRYDFTDEWNNLGYGAIRADDSIWAMRQWVQLPKENCLAHVYLDGKTVGAYAGLWLSDLMTQHPARGCLLWFNRAVGPVDSQEWRAVEAYLAHHAWETGACQPVLSEVPHGFEAAVTMRLDCDEDVESARGLWQTYQELKVPFSLALHAKVLADARHHGLPREVLARGGAILSHTATHAPDWGGSYEAALDEANTSAQQIAQVIGQRVRYAVSPFHQTPAYARAALADAGYEGCIGGIIRNDPDFLMARSGPAPGSPTGFIGHSQQCMLHGDCILNSADPLATFKHAFELARESRTFFGYLDHPFSERYQYGWATEQQRIQMHVDFINHMQSRGRVLFANENDALDFLLDRAAIEVQDTGVDFHVRAPDGARSIWQHAIEYTGRTHVLLPDGLKL